MAMVDIYLPLTIILTGCRKGAELLGKISLSPDTKDVLVYVNPSHHQLISINSIVKICVSSVN